MGRDLFEDEIWSFYKRVASILFQNPAAKWHDLNFTNERLKWQSDDYDNFDSIDLVFSNKIMFKS